LRIGEGPAGGDEVMAVLDPKQLDQVVEDLYRDAPAPSPEAVDAVGATLAKARRDADQGETSAA
jgi:hypothetical protein